MQRRLARFGVGIVPLVVALLAVRYESPLTAWASRREGVLPVGVFVLLSLMMHPALRQGLVITLCYGVAFMAIRDIGRVASIPLPQAINYDFIDQARPAILALVAGLSAAAAVAETWEPGTVWARRCYFGAAGLYFTGLGITHLGRHGSWQTLVLCATGIMALIGCVMAPRIVAYEVDTEEVIEISDVGVQQLTNLAHQRTLAENEWHDEAETETDRRLSPF